MKRILAGIALLCSMVPAMAGAQVLFNQNFSSSTTVGDYKGGTIGDNNFTVMDLNAPDAGSITGGALRLTKGGVVDSVISKTFAAAPVPMLKVQVDVNFAFTGLVTGTSLGYFDFGRSTGGASWGHLAFTVGSADNTWGIMNNAGNGTGSFTGTQTLTMFLNDSGSTAQYTAPNGVVQTIADGVNDVWVGNTLAQKIQYSWVYGDGVGKDLTGFRYVWPSNAARSGTTTFDNFRIEKIPTTAVMGPIVGAADSSYSFQRYTFPDAPMNVM